MARALGRLRMQVENVWPVFPSLWGFAAASKDYLQLKHCHLYTEIKIKYGKGHWELATKRHKVSH